VQLGKNRREKEKKKI